MLCMLLGAGCRSNRVAQVPRVGPARIKATETRVDAVPGRTLVIPVTLEGAIDPKKPVKAQLDDGRVLEAPLSWVSVTLPRDRDAWLTWLEPPGKWAATPAAASTVPSATGGWVVSVEIPLDAMGQGLWLNGERVPLNWMGDPAVSAGGPIPWREVEEVSRGATLLRLAEPERRSPVRRWRYRLLTSGPRGLEWGMEGEAPPGLKGAEDDRFADPVIEALARQNEARWAAALGWLWLADVDLAERVRRRLVAAVDFGEGVVAPAWPTRLESLEALKHDLLNPKLGPDARSERATAWLESLPPAAAWVKDDAGLRGSDGKPLASVGVANLTERGTLAWLTPTGSGQAPPNLTPVPAQEVRVLSAGAEGVETEGLSRGQMKPVGLSVHAGRWVEERSAILASAPVSPPGLTITALLGDWTMSGLLSGAPDAAMTPEPEWLTAVRVCYRARGEGSAGSGEGWWVYVECKSPPGKDKRSPAADETVRVWIGPPGNPSSVLRISSRGNVVDEQSIVRVGEGLVRAARVTHEADRWVCEAPLPTGVVEQDGAIRIGVERTDALGRRSAWPRPMLPWQVEPGRIRADTRAWGTLDDAETVRR